MSDGSKLAIVSAPRLGSELSDQLISDGFHGEDCTHDQREDVDDESEGGGRANYSTGSGWCFWVRTNNRRSRESIVPGCPVWTPEH